MTRKEGDLLKWLIKMIAAPWAPGRWLTFPRWVLPARNAAPRSTNCRSNLLKRKTALTAGFIATNATRPAWEIAVREEISEDNLFSNKKTLPQRGRFLKCGAFWTKSELFLKKIRTANFSYPPNGGAALRMRHMRIWRKSRSEKKGKRYPARGGMSKKASGRRPDETPPNFIFNSAEGGIKETPPQSAPKARKKNFRTDEFLSLIFPTFYWFPPITRT